MSLLPLSPDMVACPTVPLFAVFIFFLSLYRFFNFLV